MTPKDNPADTIDKRLTALLHDAGVEDEVDVKVADYVQLIKEVFYGINRATGDNPAAELQRIVDESTNETGFNSKISRYRIIDPNKLMQALVMREVARDERIRSEAFAKGREQGRMER